MQSNCGITYLVFHNSFFAPFEGSFCLFYVFGGENKPSYTKVMRAFNYHIKIGIVYCLVIITTKKVVMRQISTNIKRPCILPKSLLIFKLGKEMISRLISRRLIIRRLRITRLCSTLILLCVLTH